MKNNKCYILTVGDEILYGQIQDTNSRWLGERLASAGFQVVRKASVGDREEEILEVLGEALRKAEVVLITGGLGPTLDDKTKDALATFFNSPLTKRDFILDDIATLFGQPKQEINRLNQTQAWVPEKAEVIRNTMGTAPGLLFDLPQHVVVALPGVPHEMKKMVESVVLERIKQKFSPPAICHQMIRTIGIPESRLADVLADWELSLPASVKVAYLPRLGQVRIRLTGTGEEALGVSNHLRELAQKAAHLLGDYVYALDDLEIEEAIGQMLLNRGETLAVAESCTGGLVANRITDVPGCSAYFVGGIVAYSNEVKAEQLGVSRETLTAYGAVSEEVACQMAENVRQRYGATYGLSATGVAGPGGGTPEKPVGTIWIGYSDASVTFARKLSLSHDRMMNTAWTFQEVMNLLRLQILAKGK